MNYLDRAFARARRRKSRWNVLLPIAFFAVIVPMSVLLLVGVEAFRRQVYPDPPLLSQRRGVGVILETFSLLLAVIPISLLITNCLVWLVRPARRALDEEAKPYTGTSFSASQRALLRLVGWWVPATLELAVLGALLPW